MRTNFLHTIWNGKGLPVLLALFTTTLSTARLNAETRPFFSASIPVGVATDNDGNVFVSHDAVLTTLVTKVSPGGQALGSVQIGGITVGNLGHLAFDAASNTIWDLLPGGDILQIDGNSGQVRPLLNLKNIAVDVSNVFDVASGTTGPFDGMVPQFSTYGDIALLRRNDKLDVFVSGLSVSFPFVMRLRFPANGQGSASVLVASRASGAGYSSSPRGVAVNPQGVVLTTLPTMNAQEFEPMDRLFAFSADFPETKVFPPAQLSGEQLFSRGMTSDANGNFYVASGAIGVALCGAGGSGALLRISADLHQASCVNLDAAIAESEDVAVSPRGDTAYMTVRNMGLVVSVGLTPPQTAAAAGNGAAQGH